jgi:tetratricopeptide (TPR) repeat protein
VEALEVADRATVLLPKSPIAWARRGQVLRRLGDPETAIESYQKALNLDDTYAWAWNGQGLAFAQLERWDEAISSYELAVYYNERDIWFWHNFGDALIAIGDYGRAVEAFERAAALDPRHESTQQKLRNAREKYDELSHDDEDGEE